jgi:hypothetical protein
MVVIGSREESNGLPSGGTRKRRTKRVCLTKVKCEAVVLGCGKEF